MNMAENIKKILYDGLALIYQSFWFAVLFAVVFMFAYKNNSGLKDALKKWVSWFKKEKKFRRVFFLAFYTALILFRTLLKRSLNVDPLANVMGEWSFFDQVNGKTVFNSSVPENLIMLAPFIFLLFFAFREEILKNGVSFLKVIYKSLVISFVFSLSIETAQLLFHLGTWQLSDLVYNTLGGILGGVIYFIAYKIVRKHKNKKKGVSQEDEI